MYKDVQVPREAWTPGAAMHEFRTATRFTRDYEIGSNTPPGYNRRAISSPAWTKNTGAPIHD
jgi:hypothetical protein